MPEAIGRGLRALARDRRRVVLTLLFLTLAAAVALSAVGTRGDTARAAEQLRRTTATLIQVNPAGVAPGGGSSETLPQSLQSVLEGMQGVASAEAVLRRQFRDPASGSSSGVLNGVEPDAPMRLSSAGSFTGSPPLIDGRRLEAADGSAPVAVVGQVLADRLDLRVGSALRIEGPSFRGGRPTESLQARVVGIFRTGIVYADTQLFVPLGLAQSALGVPEQVSQFWVQADDAGVVPDVEQQIAQRLAPDVDVLAQQPGALAAQGASAAVRASTTGAAVTAAGVAALLVASTMALAVRERRRELAVYRALGAPRSVVVVQLAAEAIALAVVGVVAGAVLAGLARSGVLGALGPAGGTPSTPPGEILLAAVVLAVIAGGVGSLYPTWRVLRLSPAEALTTPT